MAIAAAGQSSTFARRRRSHRGVIASGVVIVVALAAAATFLVRRDDSASKAHGTHLARVSSSAQPSRHATTTTMTTTTHASTPARSKNPFTKALTRWLAHRGDDITAAVEDLRTGTEWTYRPGHPEHTASIVKVDILATLLHQRQHDGGLSAQDRELATGMIESSDDDDATDLWNAVGGAGAVQDFDDEVGMHQTRTNAAWGLTQTTPVDQIKLLRTVLFKNALLDRASRDYEYGLMRSIIPYDTWGVTAGPEHHAKVAFKNGWLPDPVKWQVNSIGSVNGAGRHYLIAVMTAGNPTWDYGIASIEHISRAVWSDLKASGRS